MQMSAGKFKARCLKLMDRVANNNTTIVITKYGKPIAKMVSLGEKKSKTVFGYLKGSVSIKGDVISK